MGDDMVVVKKKVKARIVSRLWKSTEISGLTIKPCDDKSCKDIPINYKDTKKILFRGNGNGLRVVFDKKKIMINANEEFPKCHHEGTVYECNFKNSKPILTRPKELDTDYEHLKSFTTDTLSLRSRPMVDMTEYNVLAGIGIAGGSLSFLSPFALVPIAPVLMALLGGGLFGNSEVLDNNNRTKWLLPDQMDVHELNLQPEMIEEISFDQHPYLMKMDVKFKHPLTCNINEKTETFRWDGFRRLDCGI